MTAIPDIAFAPDISGVCSVGGTLVITSKPANAASTKMYSSMRSALSITMRRPFRVTVQSC